MVASGPRLVRVCLRATYDDTILDLQATDFEWLEETRNRLSTGLGNDGCACWWNLGRREVRCVRRTGVTKCSGHEIRFNFYDAEDGDVWDVVSRVFGALLRDEFCSLATRLTAFIPHQYW